MYDNSYNKYTILPELPYNIITHLFTNDKAEIIWKLLKYDKSDAWQMPDLTIDEKAALVYNGEPSDESYRVFRDYAIDDGQNAQKSFLRISVHSVVPESKITGIVNVSFEVLTHTKISHLSNYQQRVDVIIQKLIDIFNGANIGGLGYFYFNSDRSHLNMVKPLIFKNYKGKMLIMSVNIG